MAPIVLSAGIPQRLSVEGRTLSIINDALLAQSYAAGGFIASGYDLAAGSVLVALDATPKDAASAYAIVPPFSSATIPVPKGTGYVSLLYPARLGAGYSPAMEGLRTRETNGSDTSGSVVVACAWSDVEGPLAVFPTGTMLPRGNTSRATSLLMPVDPWDQVIPPSPLTPVYDQDVGSGRHGAFFRPHIAPSGVDCGVWQAAASNTLWPATLSGDIFYPAAAPVARSRVILRVEMDVWGTSGPTRLVIGTSALQIVSGGGVPQPSELIRLVATADGHHSFDFGEGIAPNFDGSSGPYQYYAGVTGARVEIMVIHG